MESTTQISTDRMMRYELAAFIRNAREVITDPAAEHQVSGQVYSRARGPAYRFLENYYHENDLEHDPFKVAQRQSVSVQIDSILPLSKSTWQVRWTEEASGPLIAHRCAPPIFSFSRARQSPTWPAETANAGS
jgi:type IV secretion system protein TrbF